MPPLVLDEPHGSVLHAAAKAAVEEQITFARHHHVPWGISESAYAGSDHTLAYQYAPQGVPALALRRTPIDELVVAPYATALAAQVAPHRAAANLRRLEAAQARGRYGFIEALDYTPARQSGAEGVARVETFMAHHQGMSVVALANVLLARAPRRWGMGDPRIEAVASLLHERAPREVPRPHEAPASSPPERLKKRGPGVLRHVLPGMAAVEPTHLLSNGRYAVSLRANGAGTSRRGRDMVSRSRDDALRDAFGSFFHLRWDRQPRAVSLTQHPAPDRAADYHASFHGDRAWFGAVWSEIESEITVWVSPEDDIEFRRVVLRNRGDRMLDLELMSSFEVSLADARADEAHPAFQNLFVSAEWQAGHQALVFERKPRLAHDKGVLAAHFIAEAEPALTNLRLQVDRQRWLGRNRGASHPLADFDEPPGAAEGAESAPLDTGLDPVAAFALRLQIAPGAMVRVTFCTAAADNRATLRAVIDKYRQRSHVERASMMSATLAGIRLRDMRLGAETFAAIQTLTTLLALTLTRPHALRAAASEVCDRRLLWRFGISGDRPIVLVSAGVAQGFGLLRSLAQALRLWSWGGVACDLVVVNHEPASYLMALRATDRLAARGARRRVQRPALRRRDRLLHPRGRRPAGRRARDPARPGAGAAQCRRPAARPSRAGAGRGARPRPRGAAVGLDRGAAGRHGRRDRAALAARRVRACQRRVPLRCLGPRAADPALDQRARQPGLRRADQRGRRRLQLGPQQPAQHADAVVQRPGRRPARRVVPAPGHADDAKPGASPPRRRATRAPSTASRTARGTAASATAAAPSTSASTWCVDPDAAVKQVRLRLLNRGHRTINLRIVGIAEWILGANRADRGTTVSSAASQRAAPGEGDGGADAEPAGEERRMTTLFCSQRDRAGGFGGGTAFFGLAGDAEDLSDWTCDRRESFDARGRLVIPDQYGQAQRRRPRSLRGDRHPHRAARRRHDRSAPSCSAGPRARRARRRWPRAPPWCRR